jgi:hypothetical protein
LAAKSAFELDAHYGHFYVANGSVIDLTRVRELRLLAGREVEKRLSTRLFLPSQLEVGRRFCIRFVRKLRVQRIGCWERFIVGSGKAVCLLSPFSSLPSHNPIVDSNLDIVDLDRASVALFKRDNHTE